MICVRIDIVKDKHDCYIVTSDDVLINDNLRITNTLLKDLILFTPLSPQTVKSLVMYVYGLNLPVITVFPLAVKSQTLRRTKTDKVDAKFITTLLFNSDQIPAALVSDEIRELKSPTRYRYRLFGQCTKLKVSVSRLLTILFPELGTLI